MTESMKFIPVPNEVFEEIGFDESKMFQVEFTDGKLVVTQPKDCILPEKSEADCEDCCFCCPNCGECLAEQFITICDDEESEVDSNA